MIWTEPIPLDEMKRRLTAAGDKGPEAAAWLDGQAKDFRCEAHPDEPPSVELPSDQSAVRIVCARCRRAADPVALSSPRAESITGCLVPFRTDDPSQPVLFTLPNHAEHWVLVFSDLERLRETMGQLGAPPGQYRIRRIEHGYDFTLSIHEGGARVALDARLDRERGVTRWTEIVAEGRGQG